jgi:hypothetical protein
MSPFELIVNYPMTYAARTRDDDDDDDDDDDMIVIRGFPDRAARYIVSSRTKRYIEAHVNDSSYSLPKFCVFRNHHTPPPPPRARVREGKRGERLVDGDGAMLLSSHPEHDLRADVST